MLKYLDDAVADLKKAMADNTSVGAIHMLENFVSRYDKEENRTSRAFLEDGTPIDTRMDFIAAIEKAQCHFENVDVGKERYTGTLSSIRITPANLQIRLKPNLTEDDALYSLRPVPVLNVEFTCEYRNDNDKDIKMKVAYVKLVPPSKSTPRGR